MEIALNSDTPGGFKHENAITSQNGLALLASITLKNALNINNNNNNDSSTKNNITRNSRNNHLNLNQNKNNIKHHEAPPQPQQGFFSSPTTAATFSLSSSANAANLLLASLSSSSATTNTAANQHVNVIEQKNVFSFTTAGLQALNATAVSTIESETRAKVVSIDHKPGPTNAATYNNNSNNKNNHQTSLSTNHHQTNHTPSAKDPTAALLEALSIKTKKTKQSSVSTQQQQQQQQTSSNSSTITTTFVGNGGNNNANNSNNNGSCVGNGNGNKSSYRIPSDILDDLASRFIINAPDMELSNLIRICFQIELAHWFYLDFFCASEEEKKLQPCGIKQFALQIFEHIPFLRQHLSSIDTILEDWKNYKLSVPTYGAILISEDLNYCLLVQSYFAKSSWGFPKGKINENEDPVHCAAREVYEETGYDITELIVPNDYIEAVINYQYTRLYIVRDVSLETKFSPRTRNEIKCCDWFPIDSLPVNKNDAISKPKLGRNANSFFMIMPFVKRLKKWVNDKRNGIETQHKYSSGGSPISTSPLTTALKNGQQLKSNGKKQQKRNNSNNFHDEINALYSVGNGGGGGGGATATTAALAANSCGNNANVNCSNSNSNRSKRQRHKSMGDLDVTKLNNFNNCNNNNNQTNCKTTNNQNNNNNNNNCGSITLSGTAATANGGANLSCNNINTNNNNNSSSNQKRNIKILAAGSSVSNTNNGCTTGNNNNNTNSSNGGNSSSKRQLFHSQSQTNNLQQNGEKIVSSFDLIRKEKQMKAAAVKTQKQQQNTNNNSGRQRAKSQSDRMCQQQQQQQQQQKSTGNASNNKQQQRLQKQQSLTAANTSAQNYNNNPLTTTNNSNKNSNNNNNNNNTKSDVNDNLNNKTTTIGAFKTRTPSPLNGSDLLNLAVAAAAAPSLAQAIKTSPQVSTSDVKCDQEQVQQKPTRPSSVSLHFPEVSPFKYEPANNTAQNHMPQLARMASGTNLRILKRSTSQQPTQQQQQQPQPPQRQASALQFTPSFNSWTNFTFTKNFIANVFC